MVAPTPVAPPALLGSASGGHGQWYDVMGSPGGRSSVMALAQKLLEEDNQQVGSRQLAMAPAVSHWWIFSGSPKAPGIEGWIGEAMFSQCILGHVPA